MKLHARLTITFTALTATTLLACFATAYVLVQRDEARDLDLALRAQAEVAARQPSIEGDARVPEKPAAAVPRFAALYDAEGNPKTSTRAFAGRAPSLRALGIEGPPPEDGTPVNLSIDGRALRGVIVPTDRGPLLYAVSRRSIDEDMRFLARVFAALFVAAVAATTMAARWLGRRLANDVTRIAEVARAVSAGDLHARVGPSRIGGSKETKELALDLDGMIERLEQAMNAQRTFVSHAAHELRSPLATLRGELQLALRRQRNADEYRAAVEQALADVEELRQLAEDLLTLARVQGAAGTQLENRRGPFEVRGLIADAVRMAQGLAAARSIRIDEGNGASALVVTGNRNDLSRALRNLLDNAINHSPTGAAVRVVTVASGDAVEVWVEDDGPGVADEDLERIFTPFWRGSAEESGVPGAGLGLAIAREIARKNGGDILVAPTAGEHAAGARFLLRLRTPAAEAAG